MISLFYVTMFVLSAKLFTIYALILEVFGGLNLVSLSVFLGLLLIFRTISSYNGKLNRKCKSIIRK